MRMTEELELNAIIESVNGKVYECNYFIIYTLDDGLGTPILLTRMVTVDNRTIEVPTDRIEFIDYVCGSVAEMNRIASEELDKIINDNICEYDRNTDEMQITDTHHPEQMYG